MGLYVYCPRKSTGAFELARALDAKRLRKFDGLSFWDKTTRFDPEEGSTIVCWGTALPPIDGLRVLNSMEIQLDKYQQWVKLSRVVLSPRMSKPDSYRGERYYRESGYVPRSSYHTGGLDLLGMGKTVRADYYTFKENFTNEYRIHSFNGRSIRAGQKVPREGFTPVSEADWKPNSNLLHPWVRSYDGGWKISYNEFSSTPLMREIAHKAVKTLGLTFGAVDLAQRPNGDLVVLEVNTAPGIEGNTLNVYARAVKRWVERTDPEGV